MNSYEQHFSRFFDAFNGGAEGSAKRLHFAAHSHHPWPDASWDGHEAAWRMAAERADDKWEQVFAEVVPAAQRHVARILNLPEPDTICFGTSTHELLVRLLSCLPVLPRGRGSLVRPRVLTTDGEFHSAARQLQRLEDEQMITVERVPVEPFETFVPRFAEAARKGGHDLVFYSQVFFNSGYAPADWNVPVYSVHDTRTLIVIDGYHAFMAVPVDLSAVAQRVFYLGGGYKYAMAGEGAAFMHCPPGYAPAPVNTGWFAGFGDLAGPQDSVDYPRGGGRFMGATFDPSGLMRFNAVQDWLVEAGLDTAAIRNRVVMLQSRLLERIARAQLTELGSDRLLPPRAMRRGNFLCWKTPQADAVQRRLRDLGVTCDYRDDRLRIGFGIYHDPTDVDALVPRLAAAVAR